MPGPTSQGKRGRLICGVEPIGGPFKMDAVVNFLPAALVDIPCFLTFRSS